MIEMKTSSNKEIEITISHHKYIRKVKISLIIWLIIPTIAIALIVTPFLLMFIAELFILSTSIINYYYFRKSVVALEKLIIKKDILIIQDISNYKRVISEKKIKSDDIKEIFFKDSLSAYFSRGGGIGENRKFLKIRTFNELFSFGILIDKSEYNQIKTIILEEFSSKSIKFKN
ncbi:hypothetical protein [Fusobacterium massiliense]|uniref:hypothetical protein n=1 Tax=Fusobacterium massiliense TaxID=1852365 RepID=UPI0028D6B3FA|nr:hypothetical protein [Fusobacterium massiliense]